MEAKESGSLFLYANTIQCGLACYKGAIAKNTWKADQVISALASAASGCMLQHLKKWMEQQYWHGKCLDKDIIAPRSKLYSPETCAFVLQATNLFVTARDACRGEYPIGVDLCKRTGKYHASCKNLFTGKKEHLGYFSTPEEAHEAWRKRKHELAQLVADTESDLRIVAALRKRYSFEEWYKSITPP